jgi:hypothetical protein
MLTLPAPVQCTQSKTGKTVPVPVFQQPSEPVSGSPTTVPVCSQPATYSCICNWYDSNCL